MNYERLVYYLLICFALASCNAGHQSDRAYLLNASALSLSEDAVENNTIDCELISSWIRAKEFTRRYLDAMPEEHYDFQPTPEILSFAHEFLHLACVNYRYAAMIAGGYDCSNYDDLYNDPALQSKEGVMNFVMNSYDAMISRLEEEEDLSKAAYYYRWECDKECISRKGFEHQSHHRGKAAIYLRLKGIAPPFEMLVEDWNIPKDITQEDWAKTKEYQEYQRLIDTE